MNKMLLLPNTDEEILNTHDEDIIITTSEGKIIKVTQISGEHYGLSPSDLLGKSVYDLEAQGIFSPAITPEVVKQKKKIVTVQTTPSGRKVLITGIPLFNDHFEVEFVISYSYELSELIVMKEYLNDLEDEMSKVKEELAYLRDQQIQMDGAIMDSHSSTKVVKTALKIAQFDASVVLLGERGVGKTTLAKFIHGQSKRKDQPFIEVNCGTIPDAIFEIAFTIGNECSQGYLSLADNGTLVLKEIDQLSSASQALLFKLLNQHRNIRVIALCESSLETMVNQGKFRDDLFYLLHIATIHIKPLRERLEDLEKTIHFELHRLNEKYGESRKITDEVFLHLLQIEWKGNFREIKNVMERSYLECESSSIAFDDLPPDYQPTTSEEKIGFELEGHSLPHILEFVEKKVLLNAQKRYKTTTEMANILGISQPSVVRKLKKYSTTPLGDDIL